VACSIPLESSRRAASIWRIERTFREKKREPSARGRDLFVHTARRRGGRRRRGLRSTTVLANTSDSSIPCCVNAPHLSRLRAVLLFGTHRIQSGHRSVVVQIHSSVSLDAVLPTAAPPRRRCCQHHRRSTPSPPPPPPPLVDATAPAPALAIRVVYHTTRSSPLTTSSAHHQCRHSRCYRH